MGKSKKPGDQMRAYKGKKGEQLCKDEDIKKTEDFCKGNKISDKQFEDIIGSFMKYDVDDSGSISAKELETALRCAGANQTKKEFEKKVKEYDKNGSGELEIFEFCAMVYDLCSNSDENLKKAFKKFDKDGSGNISAAELKKILTTLGEEKVTEKEAQDIINEADKNGDGQMNIEEFMDFLKAQ